MSEPASFHGVPTDPSVDPLMLIDAFLAGELTGEALSAFEARLAADPSLRAQLEAQTAFDTQLKQAFALPATPLAAPASSPAPSGDVVGIVTPATSGRSRNPWMKWAAAAAILLAGLGVGGMLLFSDGPAGKVYSTIMAQGFKPVAPCPNDPDSFAKLVGNKLGHKLFPHIPPDSGIALTGWGYAYNWGTPLSDRVLILLATRGSDRIVIFVDLIENDRKLSKPGWGKHLHRRVTGNFVLYEISMVSEPVVIPLLDVQ